MQIRIQPSPIKTTRYYEGTYLQPHLWEDEYEEDLFPLKKFPFIIITKKDPQEPVIEQVLSIKWVDELPPNPRLIEEEILESFYSRD